MAQHKQTAYEFIQSAFSPQIAVFCSNDAGLLCQKNNLSFVQLVQPFCRLKTEAHIKDPNNVQHSVQHLRIGMVDMNVQIPSAVAAKKLMNDAVNNEQPQIAEGNRGNVITVGDYDLQLSSSTPWFEAYRESFLQSMPPSDHEFLKHCLACIFVVSSGHTDPLAMLHTLSSSQQQQQSQFPNKLPHWFSPNILKYYVLLHDVVEAEQSKAEDVYQSMKSSFGHQSCHLLQINSRSLTAVETIKMDTSLPDPWGQFLQKKPDTSEGVDYDAGGSSSADDGIFPSSLDEGTTESLNSISQMITNDGVDGQMNDSVMDHPLALSEESPVQSPSMEQSWDSHPASMYGSKSSLSSLRTDTSMSKSSSFSSLNKSRVSGHGMCLTASDQDRLRIFIHEFAVRALIPWAERQMKTLNDMLLSRTGLRKSLFGHAKKLFGGNPSKSGQASNTATTVVYSKDAPELQMRRLADLAFLFQLYEFAYQTYHTAKRDFNNDNAWLHFAGALEMASLAVFMQNNQAQRQYPEHYMESAITTYFTSCKNVAYAVRATLVSTEALKSRGKYKEAAMQFIKMMSEDSDLRSALLLEQAAHCFINMKNAMVRKYAFHMILAGHRFSKAGQRKHALRAYSQALQIYKGKGWCLAEDHINFTIGRQSHNLKQLENATAAFKHLLTEDSKQNAMQQNAFLREYLFVYKKLLDQEQEETGLQSNTLPELPLPALDSNATKVVTGSRPQPPEEDKMFATGVWFEESEVISNKWMKLEELLVCSANEGSLPIMYRPTLQLYTNNTNNKFSPVAYVREPITIELYLVNPLKVALTLTDVMLLWSFLPTISTHEKPQLITNEHLITAKNNLADEIVHGRLVSEIVLQGNDKLPVQMTLIPQQMGELRIYGITYNLGSASTTFMAPSQGATGILGSGAVGASYVSTVFVRGKQKIEVQGPRLNSRKEEMVGKVYGPDRRLDITIQQQMPLLQVSFVNFPKTLLCGEVHPVLLTLTNTGHSPLHRLKLASSNSKYFVLGNHLESSQHSSVNNVVYNLTDHSHVHATANCDSSKVRLVSDIEIPDRVLHPNQSFSIQLYLRGNDIGGNHEVDFLFYYESAQQSQKSRYRLLRHSVLVSTVESLSVRAVAQKACRHSTDSKEIGQFLISCEMENLSQVQVGRPHVQQIEVLQISCASNKWAVQALTPQSKSDLCISSRELLQVCLKASHLPQENREANLVTFTDLPFQKTQLQIQSSLSPCIDFYLRSAVQLKPVDENQPVSLGSQSPRKQDKDFKSLNCAIELGISLIILWQAHVVDGDGGERVCVGQHHVNLEKPESFSTSYPFVLVPKEQAPIKFVKEEILEEEKKPAFEVLTQLVSYTLLHQTVVSNCFSKCSMCCVHVTLNLKNQSESDVTVLVDTSKGQLRLGDYPEMGQGVESPLDGFSWVGQTLKQFRMSSREKETIHLSVSFSKPGVYNINNLAVYVTYVDDRTEMTLQKQTKPSVITVRDIES